MKNKILVTGGSGMVGKALQKVLGDDGIYLGSLDCDLRDQKQTEDIFCLYQPKRVIHLAAKVGGLGANINYMGDFYIDNIKINTNVLETAKKYKVEKLISMLSTCIYPDKVTYPLTEDQVHSGPPHNSNFAYAYTKRMLDVQSRAYRQQYGCNFITAVPNNLFGEYDNFDLENSHVIPALIRKFYEAKKNKNENVVLWGDGSPIREFTYSEDIAKILLFLLDNYIGMKPVNVGNTHNINIKRTAEKIKQLIGFEGEIVWDESKTNGQKMKPSSNQKFLNLGWNKKNYTDFDVALKKVIDWFKENYPNVRGKNE